MGTFFPLQVCGQILQLYDSRHFYHKNIFDGPILADIATELAKSLEVEGANGIGDDVATWLHHLASMKDKNDIDVNVLHSKTALHIGQHCSVLVKKVNFANLCHLILTAHSTSFLHEDIFQMQGTFLSTIVDIIILGKMYGVNEPIDNTWPTISPPSTSPTPTPTSSPTPLPTPTPTPSPTPTPTFSPTFSPTFYPTYSPTFANQSYDDEGGYDEDGYETPEHEERRLEHERRERERHERERKRREKEAREKRERHEHPEEKHEEHEEHEHERHHEERHHEHEHERHHDHEHEHERHHEHEH